MMDRLVSKESRKPNLRFSCKPGDFYVELSTVTNPICGNNVGDYGCDFGEYENDYDYDYDFLATHRKKERTNTVDTEVSFAGDDSHEGQSNSNSTVASGTAHHARRRFDALNEIASYDDDECLIWSAESSLSAASSAPDPSEEGKVRGARSILGEKESQPQPQLQQQHQHQHQHQKHLELQVQLQLQLLAPIPPQTRVPGEALGRCVGNNADSSASGIAIGSGSRFRNRNKSRNRTPTGSPKIRGKRDPTKGPSSSSSKSAGKRLGRVASRIFPPRPKYLSC